MLGRLREKSKKPEGAPPGTLIHTGDLKAEEVRIDCYVYGPDFYIGKEDITVDKALAYHQKHKTGVTWIDVTGLHQVEIIKKLGEKFNLHPLVLEDILDTSQRPKLNIYEDFIYFVIKSFFYDSQDNSIHEEQLSIILGNDFVFSFRESQNNRFNLIKKRLDDSRGEIRNSEADYLAYRLLDTVVDSYFGILEKLGEVIFDFEEELISDPTQELLLDIQSLKKEVILLQREIWPLKGLLYSNQLRENHLFSENIFLYLRDVDDHVADVLDRLQAFRDIINGMSDIYLSNVNQKMNRVMHVLTVISTIFIPLTFIVGVYGMNFEYMPELELRYGYPITLAFMALIGISMFIYFKRNDWL